MLSLYISYNIHVIKFGKSAKRPDWDYKLGSKSLQQSDKVKDLGVIINNRLSPEDHINEKVRNMYNLLANMSSLYIHT